MTPAAPHPLAQRRQDVLLASQLARAQVLGAFNEIAERADLLAYRVASVRIWLSNPLVWAAGSAAGALVLSVALRRSPGARVLRWIWLVWRLWRNAQPALVRYRNAR